VNNNAKWFPFTDLPSAKSGAKLQKNYNTAKYTNEKFANAKKKNYFCTHKPHEKT